MHRFCLSFCFACALGGAQPVRLVEDWRQDLGDRDPAAHHSWAVCPDGTYYLADGRGGLTIIDPHGEVVARRAAQTELTDARLVGCDNKGQLYATGVRGLVALQRNRWDALSRNSGFRTAVRQVGTVVQGPPGVLYALGTLPANIGRGRPERSPVHALDPTGQVLLSFGLQELAMIYPAGPPFGSLAWSAARGLVIYIPAESYELRVYNERGRLLQVIPREPRTLIHPAQFKPPRHVVAAAALPDGRLAVQVRTEGPRGGMSIDLYGTDLSVRQTGLEFPGLLSGSDADGGLYFTQTARDAISIARARIEEPGRHKLRAGRASYAKERD